MVTANKFEQQPNTDKSKQLMGPVAQRLSGGVWKIALVAIVTVLACSAPFWLWWGEEPVQASEPVSRPSFHQVAANGNVVEVVPTATPTDWSEYRWSTRDEALNHCKVGETVLEWRGEFTCSVDMDAVREAQTGVVLIVATPEGGE